MNQKIKFHPILNEIQYEFNLYQDILQPFEDVINNNGKIKYILAYSNITMCYGEEMAFLYNNKWHTSIVGIGRDFLEAYAIIKTLIKNFNQDMFDEYVKYLYLLEMQQSIKIIERCQIDNTFSEEEKKLEVKVNLENIKYYIDEFFEEFKEDIKNDHLEETIYSTFKNIQKKYKDSPFKISKSDHIGNALLENNMWESCKGEKFKGSMVIYNQLCNTTHNNISSLNRTLKNNQYQMNIETDEIIMILSLICSCMADINNSLENLLQNM